MNTSKQNEQKPVSLTLTVAVLKHQPGMAVGPTDITAGSAYSTRKLRANFRKYL